MRRQYTEDEKATALAYLEANKGNVKRTAKQCGVPWATLKRWSVGGGINPNVTIKGDYKKLDLADLFEAEARSALQAAQGAREEANYSNLMTGAAIAVDKMRLLREQSTIISDQHTFSKEERVERLADALARAGLEPPGNSMGDRPRAEIADTIPGLPA